MLTNIKYINRDTKIFTIHENDPIHKKEDCQAKAQLISNETGVPCDLIYEEYIKYNIPFQYNKINHWYKVGDKWYYYKHPLGKNFLNELLGVAISEIFSLDTINYKIACLTDLEGNKQIGLVSENFCNPKETYRTIEHYNNLYHLDIGRTTNMYDTLTKLRSICKTEEEYIKLSTSIKKLFIRDFSTSETDRGVKNLLFKEENTGITLMPLYDYEESFKLDTDILMTYYGDLGRLMVHDYTTQQFLRDDETSQELLNKLMTIDMEQVLSTVETSHGINIPQEQKQDYILHNKRIKQLVKNYDLIKTL